MADTSLSNDVHVAAGGPELLDRVGPLWSALRRHHAGLAPQWGHDLLATSLDTRRRALVAKAGPSGLLVLLATRGGADVGYCVATVDGRGDGEVDSLFVAPADRGIGLGGALLARALAWLDERAARSVTADVLSGNDEALRFYRRHGFAARSVRLVRRPAGGGDGGPDATSAAT